jgi:hypothetical protein
MRYDCSAAMKWALRTAAHFCLEAGGVRGGLMVDEPGDTTPDEGAAEPPAIQADAIARGVSLWRHRGYEVRYQDEFLAQMVRRGGPDVLPLTLGLVAIAAVAAWWWASRSWLVVSITADAEGRLVVHRQRSRRPPPA